MASEMDEPKQYIVGRIRESLAEDERVNEMDVQVAVTGKRVFLTGNVPTEDRKTQITTVVKELVPDHEIHNQLTVRAYLAPEGAEELS